ncbi:cyclic nucleotide-binding and patatin-like phospholipase domain-containing protein [Pseudoduganella namucuonensis]|uniref:NTE family protein/lysophospholipid hydrolase n=1 Tax=Pseudoduganella namucuonensis TaxID=1035707 RepID=A0A1I7JHJ9_9BURK|nr:cyclic nucleotide-binding and patatin-like phospholipase domain-containing protein [Pseudoduganella namucuonensis]SFU84679.1 NTE family protein/lysophospholipid hydrolase [Pseudoduganella namucuonensis]
MDLHEKAIKVLRASPGFGVLDDAVLHDLADALAFEHVAGGTQVYKEGEASDSMLFVVSGGMRVSRGQGADINLYNEVRPGQSVGEVGLILQQPRTADVTAIRDSTVAYLSRASYEALLARHPLALNQVFVKTVYNFMRHTPVAQQQYAQSFAVVPLHAGAEVDEVARRLVEAFSTMGSAHLLRPPADGARSDKALGHFEAHQSDELEGACEYLVYEAEPAASAWTRRAFRQADQVIYVASAGASQALGEIEERLSQEPGSPMKRKHLVLVHQDGSNRPVDVEQWRDLREFERIYPVRTRLQSDFARLARFLTGTAVGVVLGGGGARGFAHLGVLRALEERGIPVDLIGGNSMGALIGAQYACGVPLDEIRHRTQAFASGGERLTLPVISIVSGRRVERDLKRMFGDTTMDQLWCPFFAAACNLSKGITSVQDRGALWRAVLASNSPAGLFPPVLDRGDLLVDGAILENVPVEAMRVRLGTPLEKRRGNGTIIAIDVDVREGPGAHPDMTRLSVWGALKGYFKSEASPVPSIASILYSAGHIGGANQRGRTIAQADHYLEPPVAEFSLMGYSRSREIADVGYRYAIEKIEKWTHPVTSGRASMRG